MGLTKRKDSYYVEFPVLDDGKVLKLARGIKGAKLKRWKVGCLNKGIARDMEAKIKTDLLLGKIESQEARPILFSEWARTYLALEEVSRLRSYQDRVEIMGRQLVPFFGKRLLTQIKPEEVRAFRAQRKRRDGKPASLQTVNNDHIVLKHCLNVAAKRGLLVSNPASLVPLPNPHNERDRVLNDEEWQNLFQAAKPHLRPILLVAYHLGQRLGEIVQLTWDRVDLKRGFITLRGMDTKTKKPRQVPMTPDVRATLQQLARLRSLATKHVFLYKGKPIKRISRAFRTAMEGAKVENFRFHDLRHCAATNLRRAGIDTATAMNIVGHQSEKMWKRYNAIQEADLVKAAQTLHGYLQAAELNTSLTPRTEQKTG